MSTFPRPYYAIECVDEDEALELLEHCPEGSKIEVSEKESGQLVILWVPVPQDVLRAELYGPG